MVNMNDLQQRAEAMNLIQKISAELSKTFDLNEILDLIVKGAMRLTGTKASVIHLVDMEKLATTYLYEYPKGFEHPPSRLPEKKGLTWEIVTTGKIIVISDVSDDKRVNPVILNKGMKSLIGVPLTFEGRTSAVLFLNDSEPRDFTLYEQELLSMLADHAAIAIENANRRKVQIEAIREISESITAQLSREEILNGILDSTIVLMGEANLGEVRLFDAHTNELVVVASRPKEVKKQHQRMSIEKGITGWVARNKQSIMLPDVREDDRYVAFLGETRSELAVPMLIGDDLIGVLNIEHPQVNAFTKDDLALVEAIAGLAVVAIENARLFLELGESETRLAQIVEGSAVPTFVINDEHVVTHWNKACEKLTGVPAGEVIGTKEQWRAFYPTRRPVMADLVVSGDLDLEEKMLEHYSGKYRESVVKEGAYEAEDFFHNLGGSDKWVFFTAVPLRDRKNKVTGAIETLQDITERKQVEKELQDRNKRLVELQNVTTAIAAETFDFEKVLKLIVDSIDNIFDKAKCEIRLYDSGTKSFTKRVPTGALEEKYLPRSGGTSEYVIETKEPFYAEDASVTLPGGRLAIRDEIKNKGVEAIGYLPLIREGEVIGVLYVDWTAPRRFSSYDKQILKLFADQAAIAIENARIFGELEGKRELEGRVKALDALGNISQALSSREPLNIQDMSRLLYKEARILMDLNNFYVALYDKMRDLVTFEFVIEKGEEVVRKDGEYAPRVNGSGITEYVIKEGELLYIPTDVRNWQERYKISDGFPDNKYLTGQSWLGVPIKVGDAVLGVIGVQDFEKTNAYNEYSKKVLSTVTTQLGVAIVRQQLASVNTRLRVVNKVGQVLTSGINLSEEEILNLIYEQATELMDTRNMYIALYEPDSEQPDEYDAKHPGQSTLHGTVRFGLAMIGDQEGNVKRVDTAKKEGWQPRKAGRGLTEYVIRTKQPYCPSNVERAYQTIAHEYIGKIPKSWLGVPMMVENNILGVVVLRNEERENVYDVADLEALQAIAGQAAIALRNAQLVHQLKQRIKELDTLRVLAEELSTSTLPEIV